MLCFKGSVSGDFSDHVTHSLENSTIPMKDIISQGMYQGHWDSAFSFYIFETPGAFLQGGTLW
jgi:hypothetical protein